LPAAILRNCVERNEVEPAVIIDDPASFVVQPIADKKPDWASACGELIGVSVWRGLRLGAGGTDALPALRAGYRAACIAACTDLKVPANYHWPTDMPENLSWSTIEQACAVVTRLLRRVGEAESARMAPPTVTASPAGVIEDERGRWDPTIQ
jgi:hypothetical protein